MKLKDLAVEHDYYASDSNYYSREVSGNYRTWADFYEEYHNADIDMNLVYRWDIHQREESKRYYMELFIIGQRKGIYVPILIDYVDEEDVESIISFLQPHLNKLISLWKPIKTDSK